MEGKEFKTLVPAKKHLFREILREHPFRNDAICGSCRYRHTCSRGYAVLPIMLLRESEPPMHHKCPKIGEMEVYVVIPYEGDLDERGFQEVGDKENRVRGRDMYLLDANIMINSINHADKRKNSPSDWVLKTAKIRRATTRMVLGEVRDLDKRMLERFDVIFEEKRIDRRLRETKTDYGKKQPSLSDLSLIQAAIDHPEVKGIVTFDTDFKNMAAAGLIKILSGRSVSILTPNELMKKMNKPRKRRRR